MAETLATIEKSIEKLNKKSREEKLRENKIESEILKSLNAVDNPAQKLQIVLKRCVEAERQNKSFQMSQKQSQKTIENLLNDKDNIQAELNRILMTKSKLENLCRELQTQNKAIKEESFSKIRDEEERRKKTQEKFQQSINDIQVLMTENSEKNKKLEVDNQEMSTKFKYILEQYELREKDMEKINKQMELVTQLNEAKLSKAKIESLAEKENFLKQMTVLEETIKLLKQQLADSLGTEKILKAQVDMYSAKYGEFTSVFEGYKTDMTKMSKKTIKMEKEALVWKSKFEKSNAKLIDLLSDKQVRDEHIQKTTKKIFYLEKLCRTLSSENKAYLAKLKTSNIEIPVVTETNKKEEIKIPDLETSENNVINAPDKLDTMTKNCDELKKNLAQLQGKLESIAVAEIASEENAADGNTNGDTVETT